MLIREQLLHQVDQAAAVLLVEQVLLERRIKVMQAGLDGFRRIIKAAVVVVLLRQDLAVPLVPLAVTVLHLQSQVLR
jgi:hypothetical protein